ncbi:HAD-IIIC family phosphatase [Silvibacterium sp.]|uniref:HAD-IIIC family phosphatase n=1 Tax=Silvibacterium sp. TaxID=1964179 RepID=UPI0039E6F4B3
MNLSWLPESPEWNAEVKSTRDLEAEAAAPRLVALANARIDFVQTAKLDRLLQGFGDKVVPHLNRTKPVRLALIGSSTLAHLVPAIRIAALRRGFYVEIFEGHYGSYLQELADPNSELYAFKPHVVLLALDAHHLTAGDSPSAEAAMDRIRSCWELAKNQLGAVVIQQTILPVFPALLGENEYHMPSSPAAVVTEINHQLRVAAREAGVHLLAVDQLAQQYGLNALYDQALWHRSKQEIHPSASPVWGDHVGRLLAALRGLSFKCLVLDLDNTCWGGVIGDDGLEGIQLGQGNAAGEAFVAFQKYAAQLASRGIILAVCSKNDEANAKGPFEKHPDMVLRLKDIACFVANWQDKAGNLRHIAKTLNIGIDSLVFADDNPFERNLVRQELPMVAVPELSEDPAYYIDAIASAGYFEGLTLTSEDRERTQQYQANSERERLKESVTDMDSYLRSLQMQMVWLPFEPIGQSRVAQLINKSNQFNLTTRRYTEEDVAALMGRPDHLTLQLRLLDKFGDNGMIAVIVGKPAEDEAIEIDTWLMSCRVLGRQVEEATLNLIVEQARSLGAKQLIGRYLPSAKNGMVKEHYAKLGFTNVSQNEDGSSEWVLDLNSYGAKPTHIQTVEGTLDHRADLLATH